MFLGVRLKNFRLSKSLNILDVPIRSGISTRTISGVENLDLILSLDKFYKYLVVLKVTPDENFFWKMSSMKLKISQRKKL